MSIVRVKVYNFKSIRNFDLSGFTDYSAVRFHHARIKNCLWEALRFVLRDDDDQQIPLNRTKVKVIIRTKEEEEEELGKEIINHKIIYTINNDEVSMRDFIKALTRTKISFINWTNDVETLTNFNTTYITSYLKERALDKLDPKNEMYNELASRWQKVKTELLATKAWTNFFKSSKDLTNVRQRGLQTLINFKNVMENKRKENYLANLYRLDKKILPLKEEYRYLKMEIQQIKPQLHGLSDQYKFLINKDLYIFFKESMELTERNGVTDNEEVPRILKKIKGNITLEKLEIYIKNISDSITIAEEEEEFDIDLINSDEWTDEEEDQHLLNLNTSTSLCNQKRFKGGVNELNEKFDRSKIEPEEISAIKHDYTDIKNKMQTELKYLENKSKELKESYLILMNRRINNGELKAAENCFRTSGLTKDEKLGRKRLLLNAKEKVTKLDEKVFLLKVEIMCVEKAKESKMKYISKLQEREIVQPSSSPSIPLDLYVKTFNGFWSPELKEEYLEKKRSYVEFLKGLINDYGNSDIYLRDEYEESKGEQVSTFLPTPFCSIANIMSFDKESKTYKGESTLKLKSTINDLKTQFHKITSNMLKYIDEKDELYEMAQIEGVTLPFIEDYLSPFYEAQVEDDIITKDKINVDYTNLSADFKGDMDQSMLKDMEDVLENQTYVIEMLEKSLMIDAPEMDETQLNEYRASRYQVIKDLLICLININKQRSDLFNEGISFVNSSINTILKRMCYYNGEFKLTNNGGNIQMIYKGKNVHKLPVFQRKIIALAMAIVLNRVEESSTLLFTDENMPLKFEYYLKKYLTNSRGRSTQFTLLLSASNFFHNANNTYIKQIGL